MNVNDQLKNVLSLFQIKKRTAFLWQEGFVFTYYMHKYIAIYVNVPKCRKIKNTCKFTQTTTGYSISHPSARKESGPFFKRKCTVYSLRV